MKSVKKNQIIIEANVSSKNYWKDIWSFRELFYFFAWRDILVRYKQTVIGVAWSIIRPLLAIFIFSFLGYLFGISNQGTNRILMVTAAILPWQFFSSAFSEASGSLVANSGLISKIYFPRLIIPASSVIVCLFDLIISFVILIIFMICFKQIPGVNILFLPLFILQAIVTTFGLSLFIAAMNVKYRDFRYVIPFIVQIGYFISPLMFSSDEIYNSTKIPQLIKVLYSMNPMVGVIDGFRWSILGDKMNIYTAGFLISIGISLFFLFVGIIYFRKVEKSFADFI
ncbi:MAG: ABC transporter permease [Bacteroidota bacterium]